MSNLNLSIYRPGIPFSMGYYRIITREFLISPRGILNVNNCVFYQIAYVRLHEHAQYSAVK